LRLPGVIFFCISDTLVPTTYLVDTTLSYASDYDQTALAGRLPTSSELKFDIWEKKRSRTGA
ncbi:MULTISPECIES: hypothetical protein, partial [Citrobacter freundii complex]